MKGLDDPFQGPFSIRLAALQLDYFKDLLEADISDADEECEQVGSSALVALKRERERPRYGARNTLYFHLLTGPWSAIVKVYGEIYTWSFRQLTKLARVGSRWRRNRNGGNVIDN